MARKKKVVEYVALDFETYFDKDYTLRKMSTTSYIRDPRFQALCLGYRDNTMDRAKTVPARDISKLLATYDWTKTAALAHHAHFDGLILSHHYKVKPAFWYDTLSMARPLHGGAIRNDLETLSRYYGGAGKRKFLTEQLTGVKEPSPMFPGVKLEDMTIHQLEQLWLYCAQDVDELERIFKAMLPKYPRKELELIDLTVKMYTDPVLLVNKELAKQELENEQDRRLEILEKIADYLFIDVNSAKKMLRSRQQFALLLRAEGVDPPTKYSAHTGELTFAFAKSDEQFHKLLEHPNPNVQMLVDARLTVSSTIAETRPARLIEHADPTLPLYLKYGAAHTLRWGGGDKLNPQNFPRKSKLRNAIIAPPGHKLVIVDSAQIEARVVAWLAEEEKLLESFRTPTGDPYAEFASTVYGVPVAPKVASDERFVGKACILGLGYGMGAPKLQYTMKMGILGPPMELTEDFCRDLVNTYRTTYPKVKELWQTMEYGFAAVVDDQVPAVNYRDVVGFSLGQVHLPNGMALQYSDTFFEYDYWDERHVNMRYNKDTHIYGGKITENVVQALARIVVADQILEIAKKYRAVLMVHDEGVFCVPEDEAEEACKFAVQQFSVSPEWAPGLPVSAEGKISDHYQK